MAGIDKTGDTTKEICWARGDTDSKVFTFKDSDGAAINISGNTYILTVNSDKDPPGSTPPAANEQFTITGVFVTDGTDGKVGFAPGAGDTDIAASTYFYDIQQTVTASSEVKTMIKGKAKIIMDVTKA
jgi:hypothetical protein